MRTVFLICPDPHGSGWLLLRDGQGLGLFIIRHDAIIRAVVRAKLAKPSKVIVQNLNGAVESERCYDTDLASLSSS